jgi:hypothetical protein
MLPTQRAVFLLFDTEVTTAVVPTTTDANFQLLKLAVNSFPDYWESVNATPVTTQVKSVSNYSSCHPCCAWLC